MKFKRDYEVCSYDIREDGQFKPTRLLQVLEEIGDAQMQSVGEEYTSLVIEKGLAFIITRINVEVLKPVRKRSVLNGTTWVTEGRAANFPRFYQYDQDGSAVVRASSNWALIDVKTKKLLKNKDYDMSPYPYDEAPEMTIPARFNFPKELELEPAGSFVVGYTKTDVNGHMNNCKYIDELFDLIPGVENYFMTSCNVRFMAEAPYKSEVEVFRSDFVEAPEMDPRAEKIMYMKSIVGDRTNIEIAFGLKRK